MEAEPEHVQLARRALEAAEGHVNQGALVALTLGDHNKAEQTRRLLEALHPTESEEES